ncbi:hypothetical protein ACHAWO_004585 [Cyclotella atomus]|uniref:Uncharacterized protein n=1 Tax=Cyclotella atomus TaxID=382360 RepID=A0ABD3PID9_9STRA
MLTKWKQSRTTFEYGTQKNNGAAKRKIKQQDSSTSLGDIAVSFVRPLARQNPFYIQRDKASKTSGKKRRKSNHGAANVNVEDMEPILCITSSHRVAILGRSSAATASTLTESKSRNYVSRPGVGTSFNVSTSASSTLEGVASTGAQYDPASNLLYAIRNRSELAIWTAASSSVIQGPDQVLDDDKDYALDGAAQNSKKRKEQESTVASSLDRVISEHLTFPEGKIAVTLNPFYFHDEQDNEKLVAVGASGCCDDGSIWIAIYRDGDSSFELLVVDGSSMAEADVSRQTSKRKTTPAKAKETGDAANKWRLLDSRASRSLQTGNDLVVKVQSVLVSSDDNSVVLRQQHVKVSNENGTETCHIEKSVKQRILDVSNNEDVTAKFDSSANSLCVVHKNQSGGWLLSSVDTTPHGEEIASSVTSIAVTKESEKDTSLFSFGCLGQNVYAVLSKTVTTDCLRSTLRVIDVRRKVELLAQNWKEGGADNEWVSASDNVLTRMLHDKHCRAMITNELDGSLVLVTSTNSGAIGVISSTITSDSGASSLLYREPSSATSSLALALRAAAAFDSSSTTRPASLSTSTSTDDGSSDGKDVVRRQTQIEAAIDLACKELSDAADSIVGYIETLGEAKKASNGKNSKGPASKGPVNWRETFYDCITTIHNAVNPSSASSMNGLKNGLKNDQKQSMNLSVKDQPKRYITTAFRQTMLILMAINKSWSTDDGLVLESIRQEAMRVLSRLIHSDCLQSRTDCDIDLPEDSNAFVHILKNCPSVLLGKEDLSTKASNNKRVIGALDILDGMIYHLRDLPERVLVCMIRFLLRNVGLSDVTSYYSRGAASGIKKSLKGSKLATKLQELSSQSDNDQTDEIRGRVESKLLAEALLDFTSKIVTYSRCNLSLLSKSLISILAPAEAETFLVTLGKLLKVGEISNEKKTDAARPNLYMGVIDWISSLTDAHTRNILKISDEGSLVVDRIQADVRSAVNQTQSANELMELSDRVMDNLTDQKLKKVNTTTKSVKAKETTSIAAYTIERLVF